MPRRTNIFQEVVAIIHAHMAGGASVEESAMLENRVTGERREVDVALTADVAGHDVVVCVEATARGRRADSSWVESMIGKHSNLPTAQLVLVSESGFAEPARRLAEGKGVVALAPEDLAADDAAFTIMKALPAVWPKVVSLTPQGARLVVERPTGERVRVREVQGGLALMFEDERPAGTLMDLFKRSVDANFPTIAKQIGLADITENLDRYFTLGFGPNWTVNEGGRERSLYVRWVETEPPELHRVDLAEITGRAMIEVGQIPLTHRRLGDVAFAYGEGNVGENSALIVVTEGASGPTGTLRVRYERGDDEAATAGS